MHRSDTLAWAPEVAAERLAVFASDGGGRGVANQVYDGSIESIRPGEIAKDIPDFLDRLLRIAQAFSSEDEEELPVRSSVVTFA
ncbi:hypothetical protein CU254_14070 [Amycolatopsis sp. AA4]|uniref:hypothetical protein n=1 Tax=Actinomycetes TaxID=1760 RepID=UPI0001B53A43|nr:MULTISPECIES: hypothetical protein [Actinomycetes]ATY11462.1 hypothetical protein CU254_14070 [Amycolatopsis sp. AA4]EFL07087.1 predicted protein [Streptomyces sp. AA4]